MTLPPQPPAIVQPAPYEVSYGVVKGVAAPGAVTVVVTSGGKVLRRADLAGRRFVLHVDLPVGASSVRIETIDRRGRRAGSTVRNVLGLPSAARPRIVTERVDPVLGRTLRKLAGAFSGTAGLYAQDLVTGAGATWNAAASLPAASTLKLAVAVTALARTNPTPRRGSTLDGLLRQMLVYSDNGAANDVERYYAGSTSAGSALVNELMRSIGLVDTEMYGGYVLGTMTASGSELPSRVEEQPAWGLGKRTTAHDLARLLRAVWLASGNTGPLRRQQPEFTAADARYLLYVLAHVRDPGKIDREVGRLPGVIVAHKAGWLGTARHDAGLVFWRGGVLVVAVLTYRSRGVGSASDALAGRVTSAVLRRSRG